MNEVYASTWRDLTDAFNFQKLKFYEKLHKFDSDAEAAHALILHGKLCKPQGAQLKRLVPLCAAFEKDLAQLSVRAGLNK